jgi:hypothetical protein
MLEPCVGEDAVYSPEDIGQMSHTRCNIPAFAQAQPAREVFWGAQDVSRPIERMATIVDGTARLRRIVYGTQVLPF